MANMSYCRFNNTRLDMEDCICALRNAEYEDEKISAEEIKKCKLMFDDIIEYLSDEGLFEEFDEYAYEEWKSNLDNYCED